MFSASTPPRSWRYFPLLRWSAWKSPPRGPHPPSCATVQNRIGPRSRRHAAPAAATRRGLRATSCDGESRRRWDNTADRHCHEAAGSRGRSPRRANAAAASAGATRGHEDRRRRRSRRDPSSAAESLAAAEAAELHALGRAGDGSQRSATKRTTPGAATRSRARHAARPFGAAQAAGPPHLPRLPRLTPRPPSCPPGAAPATTSLSWSLSRPFLMGA